MRGRIVVTLRRWERRRLEKWARRAKDASLRLRIQVVLLYDRGLGCDRVAEMLGITPPTATRAARRFVEQGEDGLIDRRVDNGSPKVDADLLEALTVLVRSSPQDYGWSRPTWTTELLCRALFRVTRVEVGRSTVGRMLQTLGARWGMPRPIVSCPWPRTKREARIRAIRAIVRKSCAAEPVFYEDEVDLHLNPKIGRDWMLPRQQKLVMTPGQNRKRYLAGALSADGKTLIVVASHRKNSELFLALLAELERRLPNARAIHLVLDNYKIHSSHRVQREIEQRRPRIQLDFLPPYCPQENRIERLWQDLHANVTRNHRCRSIGELMIRVRRYLAAEARRRAAAGRPRSRRSNCRAA